MRKQRTMDPKGKTWNSLSVYESNRELLSMDPKGKGIANDVTNKIYMFLLQQPRKREKFKKNTASCWKLFNCTRNHKFLWFQEMIPCSFPIYWFIQYNNQVFWPSSEFHNVVVSPTPLSGKRKKKKKRRRFLPCHSASPNRLKTKIQVYDMLQ